MIQSRRNFLRALPAITVGATLAPAPAIAAAAGEEDGKHRWAMVVDVQKCIGCQASSSSVTISSSCWVGAIGFNMLLS